MKSKIALAFGKGLLTGLLLSLISGCVSLPAPDAKDMEAVPNLMQDYKTKLKAGEYDEAIAVLQQIQKRVTKSGELSGGKGRFFRDEAQAAALIGHIEFKRNNISETEIKWSESFEIEFNGLTAQHEVDQRNQDITDALANSSAAGSAKKSASKKGRRTYSYPIQNTVLAKPQMIATGKPTESIVRMPVRVEDTPFDSIVKLSNNNRSSCTATMVAPRVAISAAHCLSQNGEAIDPSVITLKRFGIFQSPMLRVQEYYTHKGMNKEWDKNRRNDWVILVTLAAIDKFTEYPVVLKKIPESVLGGTETIMLAGYSSDLNKGFYPTLHHGCTFKVGQKELAGVFLSNCDNAKGASGAAVMTTKSPYNIIAIHTAHLVSPKDDFYSVETFTPEFVFLLEQVINKVHGVSNNEPIKLSPQAEAEVKRLENLKRIQALASQSGISTNKPSQILNTGFALKVSNAIKPNIVFTEDPKSNDAAVVEVMCGPDGAILSRKIIVSSGNLVWDSAVLKAIDRTMRIPKDENNNVPPVMEISFRPR